MVRSSNPSNVTPSAKSSLIVAAGVIVAMLYFGRRIFIPLALALVLSFLLTPLVASLQKMRFGRVPSVLIVMIFCFALTVTVGWGVAGQLLQITGHISDYRSNIEEKIRALHSRRNTPLVQATATVQELNKELAAGPNKGKQARGREATPHPIPVQVAAPPANFVQDFRELMGPLAGPAETAALVIIFVAFMLTYREDLRNRLIRLGGAGQLNVMTQAMEDASQGLSRYLLLQFIVNACYGLLFGIGLYVIGVPHALLWGTLAAALRFVPYVGTWLAAAFPIAMAVAVFPDWKHAAMVFGLFAVLEFTVANVIEPWLYGAHTGISPLAILIAAIFWATLWGPLGLIVSTPLTLCLVLVGRYVPHMSFLEILLGDSPALKPHELFYQRLLAMDQDEARNVAECFLKDHSVQNLYESVLIPALRLAEEDRHSDALGDRSAEFVSQSARELIEDLQERSTTEHLQPDQVTATQNPLNSSLSQRRIVCVPARDEADELVGMMLGQLLHKSGANEARFLAIGTVEHMLDEVENGNFEIACISALPPFAVGQARGLCKRLHERFPDLDIVVGLWGFPGGVPRAQQRVGPACTDAVATSLSDAILQIRRLLELRWIAASESKHAPAKVGPKNQTDAMAS